MSDMNRYTPAAAEIRVARVLLSSLVEGPTYRLIALIRQYGPVELVERLRGEPLPSEHSEMSALRTRFQALSPDHLARIRNVSVDKKMGVIVPEDPFWPEALNDLTEPPILLYFRGAGGDIATVGYYLERINNPVAVIGSRAISPQGTQAVAEIVPGLAAAGTTVVSGGAKGSDLAGHKAALQLPAGDYLRSVAVVANGLDRWYPGESIPEYEQMCQDRMGLVVSENPPGTPPTGYFLMRRNRIIVALSQAVLVVEAGQRSGTKNAIRHAEVLGRTLLRAGAPVDAGLSLGTAEIDVPSVYTTAEVLTHL